MVLHQFKCIIHYLYPVKELKLIFLPEQDKVSISMLYIYR